MKKIISLLVAVPFLLGTLSYSASSEYYGKNSANEENINFICADCPRCPDWVYIPQTDSYIKADLYDPDAVILTVDEYREMILKEFFSQPEEEPVEEPFWHDWEYVPETGGYVIPDTFDISALVEGMISDEETGGLRAPAFCPSCGNGTRTGYSYISDTQHRASYSCGHTRTETHFNPGPCCSFAVCPCGGHAFTGSHSFSSYSQYSSTLHYAYCSKSCCLTSFLASCIHSATYMTHYNQSTANGLVRMHSLHPISKCAFCGGAKSPLSNGTAYPCKINLLTCNGSC